MSNLSQLPTHKIVVETRKLLSSLFVISTKHITIKHRTIRYYLDFNVTMIKITLQIKVQRSLQSLYLNYANKS